MADYIERAEAMHIVFRSPFFPDSLMEEIAAIPAVVVQPVRHGRWAPCTNGGYYCSACDSRAAYKFNNRYCPNCGAKMDLE